MFSKYIHKRINIVMALILLCFIVIIIKVFYIQVIDYTKLNKLANGLWSRNLPIEADRGKILTSDKKIVADNLTTVSLVFIPNQINKKKKKEIAYNIASIIGCDVSAIEEHLNKKSSIERVHPEGRRLSFDKADKIEALGYEGVYLVKESKRIYPSNLLLCHVLGYVGIDNQGLSGLELEYDKYLTGAGGSIQYYSDAKGGRLAKNEDYVKPTNGMNIELTVNYNIQSSMERELDNAIVRYKADAAWAIAMNPNNGEILGMVSRPGFDPNNYKNYSIEEINRNLAIWSTYEPGSTFKIITLAAALEENKVNLVKDSFYDGGSVNVDGARIKCWKHGGHGQQTFLEVVQNSCNPGFVELGRRLGKETLFKYINSFGFGTKTGIDLNGEGSGILFNLNRVGPVELATTAFGQGVSVTALQQITAVSAAINGGILYKPYIVKRITDSETNNILLENKRKKVRNVIGNKTSKELRYALESVVALGTGRNAYIESYRVGGKTGTAQKVNNGVYMSGNYITSFIGFLPADNPKIVIYIAIDNPKGISAYGGTVSAPIFKNIAEDAITALKIKKPTAGLEKEYRYFDTKYYTLENVIGMNIEEAKNILANFKIEYSGTGKKIIDMSPKPGARLPKDSTIRVMVSSN
ncbi:MAG: stage V sporulation protein D [Bacilli bacterium]|nr:stage V sporulation protein D [Bacilli bacterium]